MDIQTLELAPFQTPENVTADVALRAVEGMLSWLKMILGFLPRQLAQSQDSQWVACGRGASQANALVAAEAIITVPGAADFMSVIEPRSGVRQHYPVKLAV